MDGWDGLYYLIGNTAVTPRASLQSDANKWYAIDMTLFIIVRYDDKIVLEIVLQTQFQEKFPKSFLPLGNLQLMRQYFTKKQSCISKRHSIYSTMWPTPDKSLNSKGGKYTHHTRSICFICFVCYTRFVWFFWVTWFPWFESMRQCNGEKGGKGTNREGKNSKKNQFVNMSTWQLVNLSIVNLSIVNMSTCQHVSISTCQFVTWSAFTSAPWSHTF